jgi:serine/threonine protein kinase
VNSRVVAVKVIDTDFADYNAHRAAKDDGMGSTIHEINVLYQLKASNAINVNQFYEAFQVHSQFWMVNEYCPGGSIGTLVSNLL